MKRLLLTTCTILLMSCMTEQKAVNYLTFHNKLPAVCAAAFPSVDSAGKLIFISDTNRVKSIDYTSDLDALQNRGDSLLYLLSEKERQAAKISVECAEVVHSFIKRVDSLQQAIKKLKSGYKPPTPDTVAALRPYYNLKPPELAACQIALNDQKARADKATTEKGVYKQLFYYALAALIALLILFSIILFNKFVKK